MKYDPKIHHRRSIRLCGYDYSSPGAYSVTICTQDRLCLLGDVVKGQMVKNAAGELVHWLWWHLASDCPSLDLDAFQVMPNHIHGILVIRRGEPGVRPQGLGDHKDRPYARGTMPGSVGRIVQGFKSQTTDAYINGVRERGWRRFPGKLWQRDYYEHVVRNEGELNRIREYILTNPSCWTLDRYNPDRPGPAVDEDDEFDWQGRNLPNVAFPRYDAEGRTSCSPPGGIHFGDG
jgi:REP element-mobilizing transposase RayT